MNPTIVSIAGPQRGLIYELTGDETLIGRDQASDLTLNDKSVSRKHCLIRREGGAFKVIDLQSHNGTFVNQIPVHEQAVGHGDRIRVGNYHFLFLTHETAHAPEAVKLDQGIVVTGSTVRLRLEEVLSSMARDLATLFKIGSALDSALAFSELQRQILEATLDAIPAERGAILWQDSDATTPAPTGAVDRSAGPQRPFNVSRTVVQQVMSEGVAMLCHDLLEPEAAVRSESLVKSKVRSLLCVPLRQGGERLGALYLDTSAGRLDEAHLQMAAAIAGFSAAALAGARRVEQLESENQRLLSDIHIEHAMIGEGPKMKQVYQTIARIAPVDTTVLILGESGTGKELAARAVHQNSPRARKPFVAINCATLSEALLESELFGYERGAFTGAVAQKEGKLEAADGGTLFLDEVGELTLPLQAKLLRVLQERQFERLGSTRSRRVDIRVVAATNRNLEAAVAEGTLRADLFYRLNVISLWMPPLRERAEDIALLASYFIDKYGRKCKRPVEGLSAEARRYLTGYHWPGNVRELENAVERAVVLGTTARILPEDLPESVLEAAPQRSQAKFHEAVNEAKRRIVLDAIERAGGNFTEAGKLLGIHPNNLHRLVRNLDLKPDLKK
ncbi:MAG: sigma 54-interacting transcriptional regulator [Acidobacteria bacterium]|nr:sigma 54-interacting transcriptional regulator [Acidobacteriota bacterium]